ncbi:LacI family DNA-binding transcriptional regulator [Mollicutes bacterium LVI A0078]|nr:LacI family DNA-binding transcriptional regulator [Mollicutes bacterium LVI A0075]WOO91454.1 LacI family DNA-binding transcriptional regulator [Mollicutes bacterium LVI A0078]
MVTMKDVATHCGVSVSLVSKAINGYDDIKPDTKQKILDSIEALGYVPNASASSLSTKRKNKIAVIVRGYRGNGRDLFIDEISMIYSTTTFKRAIEKNIDVVILYDDIILGKTSNQIESHLKSLGITGVIMFGLNKHEDELYNLFKSNSFKKVIIDVPIYNLSTSSVSIDDVKAQIEVLEKSVKDEHKKLLYLSGPEEDITSSQRILGFNYYAKNNDKEVIIKNCNYELKNAKDYILQSDPNSYDAVICANDMMAVGASLALDVIGQNKLVTGFDGINVLNLIQKDIPTIDQNFHTKAILAVDELLSLFDGNDSKLILDTYTYLPSIHTSRNKL